MSRAVPPSMTAGYLSQAKIGARRPMCRATVQKQHMYRFDYDTAWAQGGGEIVNRDQHRTGHFATMIFGENSPLREIPNIKGCSWERTVGQDAATCTLTILNTLAVAMGEDGEEWSELDKPGSLTAARGDLRWASDDPFDFDPTGWTGVLVPDAVVKTFEGYGHDPNVMPAADPYLMQSGTWMIDKVTHNPDGTMVLEMRDLARLLLDQVVFPPAVPLAEYPLTWVHNHEEQVPARDAVGGHWRDRLKQIGTAKSSNEKFIGEGLTNAPHPTYVNDDGSVEGNHKAIHAIGVHDRDTPEAEEHDNTTFWRSTGQDAINDFVWWEFDVDSDFNDGEGRVPVAAVRVRPAGGPFRVYVSIHNGSGWVGKKEIPYTPGDSPGGVDIQADIPFVKSFIADRWFGQDWVLPRKYMAKKIRLTFTHLRQREVGEHPFRAGLREMQIYTADQLSDLSFEKGTVQKLVGNYGDYTHIIKWVCAWAGWYWPSHGTDMDFIRVRGGGDPGKDYVSHIAPDPVLPKGRVWGDFMKTGTGGIADLTVDMFDKKPLMDIINYVRDLTGFLFFIDEVGGVVWRQPNQWTVGNYVTPEDFEDGRPGKRRRYARTSEIVELREDETLWSWTVSLDSKNIRERIFVANAVGGYGVVVKAFNPYRIGLKRVAGYSDQRFESKTEARVMADLIATNAMFTYRTGQAQIPGYPKIQVDDQVKILERTTNEYFYHYVMGIKSDMDLDSGEWTYDLQTHWLGADPEGGEWVVNFSELSTATQNYLYAIGYRPTSAADNDDEQEWESA